MAAMSASLFQKDVIAIDDLSRNDLLHILQIAAELEQNPSPTLLQGKILASCFIEPSTRTRLSFESAMIRLGGSCIGFAEGSGISTKKGETLADTFRMVDAFADIAVLRHPLEGAARCAADAASIPIINGGDGANEHPTQTLLDLFAIQKTQASLENLQIAFLGDLKHSRTVRSLAKALAHFSPRLYFISPPELELPKDIFETLRDLGVKFSFHKTLQECLPKLDILYMTRLQKERHIHFDRIEKNYTLTRNDLIGVKENLKILHPLPKVKEIDPSVDSHPAAFYFEQARGAVFVRQALLALILGGIK